MIIKGTNICMRWVYYALLVVVLFLCIVMLRLYIKPVPLADYFPSLADKFEMAGYSVKFARLDLSFDGGFYIEAEDGFLEKDGHRFAVDFGSVKLSSHNILMGQVRPKEIDLSVVYLPDLNVSNEGISFGPWVSDISKKDDKQPVDIVNILNNLETEIPMLSALKEVNISEARLTIKDNIYQKEWQVKPLELKLKRNFLTGENFKLETRLRNVSGKYPRDIPLQITLSHSRNANSVNLGFHVKELNTEELTTYLPFTNPLTGFLEARVNAKLNKRSAFDYVDIQTAMNKSTIHIDAAYNKPFEFKEWQSHLLLKDDFNILEIKEISAIDSTNWPLNISGQVKGLSSGKLDLNLNLEAPEKTTIGHVNSYLPDARIPSVTGWIQRNVHQSDVNGLTLKYTGDPKRIPNCPKSCGFDGSFDFENMTMQFINTLQPAENLAGRFQMKNSRIDIHAESGNINEQQLKDTHVGIFNIFDLEKPSTLDAKGNVSGNLVKLLGHIEGITKSTKPWNLAMDGEHSSDLFLSIPLDNADFKNITLKVDAEAKGFKTSQFTNGRLVDVPIVNVELDKTPEKGTFKIKAEGHGHFDGIPMHLTWSDNLNNALAEMEVLAMGNLPNSILQSVITGFGVSITEDIPIAVRVTPKTPDHRIMNFEVDADFTSMPLSFATLNWNKPESEVLKGRFEGTFSKNTVSEISKLHLKGADVDVLGKVSFRNNKPVIDFERFNMGKSRFKLAIKDEHINIVGQILDLSFMDFRNTEKQESSLGSNALSVNVEQALLKEGAFNNVAFEMEKEEGALNYLTLSSTLPGDKKMNLNIKRNEAKNLNVNLTSNNAGYTLKALGIHKNFHEGNLSVAGTLKEDGTGNAKIHMKDTDLLKAPALFRLFSVLAIEDIITFSKGVHFDSIDLPLTITPNEYIFDPLTMKGPSVNMKVRGKLTKDEQLDVTGELIPVSRLNKLVSKIPLVGTILTGSQEGLLVADFAATGHIDDPKISSNPFSLITPGLLKDAWGIIIDEKEHDPTIPTTDVIQKETKQTKE